MTALTGGCFITCQSNYGTKDGSKRGTNQSNSPIRAMMAPSKTPDTHLSEQLRLQNKAPTLQPSEQ
eukprot:1158753-Pelagomonas_calceolata.AAC.1